MTRTVRIADPAELASAETRAIAGELIAYARSAADAVAMLEAARLLATLPREAFGPGAATPATVFAEARLIAAGDRAMLQEIDAIQYGYTRPIAGNYVADSWIVRYAGNGIGLSPAKPTNVRFRIGEPVWTAPVAIRHG
ncbi:hypothetical protein [Sphingomonas sp.]|uniref:hypothetical protein n=1 Tax=Sphingomonas sp. TaxID=28214 RepID=UPI001ECB8827|nr:hypothetical protein [Sphingomonas sp.]MBX3593707.1 hypothetical protein [Sphingomonas sp.]